MSGQIDPPPHDVDEAITLADRVLVLDSGRIAAEEVIDLPRPRDGGPAFQAVRRRLLRRLGLDLPPPAGGEGELVAYPTGEVL